MTPSQLDRDRHTLVHALATDHRRGWIAFAALTLLGGALLAAASLGRTPASHAATAMLSGALLLAMAATLLIRQVQHAAVIRRLLDLLERPDLIVWIYERQRHRRHHLVRNIYVCSRRGERLRLSADGDRTHLGEILARLAPGAPRGFSSARDAAFERDPLSVASA